MSDGPRVMLVCERLDLAGGVERFVCMLADHLAAQGMSVSVATVDTPAGRIAYPLTAAVRVVHGHPAQRAPERNGIARSVQMLRTQWRAGRTLAALIHRESPDVIVLNGLVTACSVLAVDRRFIRRTICCDHNHFTARSRLWQWLRERFYPRVAAVVSLTDADAPKFSALNPRTQVIHNASTLTADAPNLPKQQLVLAIGRHVEQKGIDLLLEAWPRVLQAQPEARLRIVGDGPLHDDLVALAGRLGVASTVEWIAPTRAVAPHFRAAAVFALPSRYEGMPLALLEAQAMGVPAVAFDCPTGPRDIVSADTGMLVPPGSVVELADALIAVLSDKPRRDAMAHASIARSRQFSLAHHFAAWTALIRATASAPA